MKKIALTTLLALLAILPLTAVAGRVNPTETIQINVALNGSQSSRTTPSIAVANGSVLRLNFDYTRSTGTAVTIHCESSDNAVTGFHNIDLPDSNGDLIIGAALFQYPALAASRVFDVRIGVSSYRFVRCYLTVTGAGAGDIVTTTQTLFG